MNRLLLIAALLYAMPALAGKLEGEPFVWYTLEHDSNLFRVEGGDEADGEAERSDTLHRYGGGVALQYSFGLQRVYLGGEARRVQYERYDALDHDGHELRAGMDWQLGHAASGELRASQEKRIESFSDRDDTDLNIQTDRRASASGTLAITPSWAVQTRVETSRLRSALDRSKNYDRDETGYSLGGLYTGSPVGTAGVRLHYLDGRFPERERADGVTDRYDEYDLQFTLGWQPSGLSHIDFEAGAARRNNRGGEDYTGVTGRLQYIRRWSGKTSLQAELFRRVVSVEEVDANFVEQTGLALRADWQALSKLGVYGRVEWRADDYGGSPALDVNNSARTDDLQRIELGALYKPMFWLNLSPGMIFERRDSNRINRSFDDLIFSFDLEARYD